MQDRRLPDDHEAPWSRVSAWFDAQGWKPFPFQIQAWQAYLKGKSGLIHAPTGVGKTWAVWMGPVMEGMAERTGSFQASGLPINPRTKRDAAEPLRVLWVTPLRALSADTAEALRRPLPDLGVPWTVEVRTGDTPSSLRLKQAKKLPTALITTPESLSLLISYPQARGLFKTLQSVVVDEWHELLGSKRGVQTELCLARLRRWRPGIKVWGLSATMGNTRKAMEILLGSRADEGELIQGLVPRDLRIDVLIPDRMERFPWAGHLGLRLLPQVIGAIEDSRSTLLFTNTRSQTEIWYQAILDARPDWAGLLALHHGSIDRKARAFVEEGLRQGRLKCVVCTSSLDLGVDFSPVDKVIQIGSPKGIARMMQRAGRSGHRPGETSRITFAPTNTLELVELAALRKALADRLLEPRLPVELPLDVLSQHLVTVALGEGFQRDEMIEEVRSTHAFRNLSEEDFVQVLDFVTRGGPALRAYPEYSRVKEEGGTYRVVDKNTARRHRMTIGTITADASIEVRYLNGKKLGTIEEAFVSRIQMGDRFVFAGQVLEAVRMKDMALWVRKARGGKGPIPQWLGGRMPLSTELGQAVREALSLIRISGSPEPEITALQPLIELQARWSHIPTERELLVETFKSREGYHLFCYPFEGHPIHEGLAALLAYRLCRVLPMTLSLSSNDYGFELLSDREFPVDQDRLRALFDTEDFHRDLLSSIHASETAKRQFRDIARISGLVFQGYPGRRKTTAQIQTSTSLLYNVFLRYDPENFLLKQATREVLERQFDDHRLLNALRRMARCEIKIFEPPHPTPMAFPIMVNRLRARVTSETLSERIRRMALRLEKAAKKGHR